MEHNGMKVGDIITTYYSGFYKLTRIERRFYTERDITQYSVYKDKKVGDEYSPMFYFVKMADAKGVKCKPAKEKGCDAVFCRLAVDSIKEQVQELNNLISNLEKLSKEI